MDFLFHCIKTSAFTVKKQVVCVALLIITFVVGIMCGVILKQPQEIIEFYSLNCQKYVDGIFFGGIGGIIIDGLISFIVYTLIALPTVYFAWFIGLQGIFLFYKGFVSGILIELLFSLYGLSGGLIFFVVFLPQTVIFSFGFISFSACTFDCGMQTKGTRFMEKCRVFYPYFLVYALFCLCALLFDIVSILLIFRFVFRLI